MGKCVFGTSQTCMISAAPCFFYPSAFHVEATCTSTNCKSHYAALPQPSLLSHWPFDFLETSQEAPLVPFRSLCSLVHSYPKMQECQLLAAHRPREPLCPGSHSPTQSPGNLITKSAPLDGFTEGPSLASSTEICCATCVIKLLQTVRLWWRQHCLSSPLLFISLPPPLPGGFPESHFLSQPLLLRSSTQDRCCISSHYKGLSSWCQTPWTYSVLKRSCPSQHKLCL